MEKHALSRRRFLGMAGLAGATLASGSIVAGCSATTEAQVSTDAQGPITEGPSWENPPAPIPDDQIKETKTVDLVVVGAGVAGGATFMTACEGGLKVALVEKTESFNARGMDIAAVNTKAQEEAGISLNKAAIVNDLVVASGYKANGELIKLWADQSGRVLSDLIDMTKAEGLSVKIASLSETNMDCDGFWNRTYPVTHNLGVELGNGVCNQKLLESMINRGIKAGGEVFYQTPAEQLITDASGAVVGVVCKQEDGYIRFDAPKGVVFASGDYSGNQAMVDKWDPILNEAMTNIYTPAGANTGDHVNMAFWVGGTMQKGSAAAMVHPIMGGGACGTYSFLRVNKDGGRFCNEDTPLPGITNAYMVAPNHTVWTIMDADFATQVTNMSQLSMYNGTTSGPFDPTLGITPEDGMKQTLESGASVTGDTIEALAEAMGVPSDALVRTVNRYNELVELGEDVDFGKDPACLHPIAKAPFYASQVNAVTLTCTGGLDVDSNMNVCSTEGGAIQGLYAVGNAAGNFFSNEYPMVCPGISHGRAITLGYVLGEALSQGVTAQEISAEHQA